MSFESYKSKLDWLQKKHGDTSHQINMAEKELAEAAIKAVTDAKQEPITDPDTVRIQTARLKMDELRDALAEVNEEIEKTYVEWRTEERAWWMIFHGYATPKDVMPQAFASMDRKECMPAVRPDSIAIPRVLYDPEPESMRGAEQADTPVKE